MHTPPPRHKPPQTPAGVRDALRTRKEIETSCFTP
jgi:hypothetical protein